MPELAVSDLRDRLDAVDQGHLLGFADTLDPGARDRLLAQIEAIDLSSLPGLISRYVTSSPDASLPGDLAPASVYSSDGNWDRGSYHEAGAALIREGKVGAFTVAGGQGSRLGFDGPKGCYPATPVRREPLFAVFAEGIRATQDRFGAPVPWYIMTSPMNHEATVAFFESHGFFGLHREDVMFFPQGVMPSFDMRTGRVLLKTPGEIATSPDGHGGSFKALWESGAVADMQERGVEHLSYFQVDNPMVRVIDPVFVGLHASAPDSSGQMSSKMIPKAYAGEKVGVFARSGEKTLVIEYSDLPADLAEATDEQGTLRFNAGSIAIHMIGVPFIERVNTDSAFELPYHRAEKKVPHADFETGAPVDPSSPNGVKLERFVFDALAMCDGSIVLETVREEEFAPIKNATGVDSAESSCALQTARAARWLEAAGVTVARGADGTPDCDVEISALLAMDASELTGKDLPGSIGAGSAVAL